MKATWPPTVRASGPPPSSVNEASPAGELSQKLTMPPDTCDVEPCAMRTVPEPAVTALKNSIMPSEPARPKKLLRGASIVDDSRPPDVEAVQARRVDFKRTRA